jgi:LPS-assembly protein
MKNNSGSGRKIDINNVFNNNRLSLGDSFEAGESLTLGIDFKKEKVSQMPQLNEIDGSPDLEKEKIFEIEEYFDFKLATVFRFNREKNIPTNSTINEKSSNIFGLVGYKPSKNISLNYNFSLTNDFNTIESQTIGASYITENFSTEFSFIEEAGILGDANVLSNETKLVDFKDYHNLSFSTRRNRKINLTEYYDLIYEYKNDCLIAGIKYRKDYYNDKDIIPKEELFFSITIIPFYTFSPDKMILNKDRID